MSEAKQIILSMILSREHSRYKHHFKITSSKVSEPNNCGLCGRRMKNEHRRCSSAERFSTMVKALPTNSKTRLITANEYPLRHQLPGRVCLPRGREWADRTVGGARPADMARIGAVPNDRGGMGGGPPGGGSGRPEANYIS